MKIYELKKMDHFQAEFSHHASNELKITLSGVFLGMDGVYAKVQYHGVEYDKEEPFALLHATTIVKKKTQKKKV